MRARQRVESFPRRIWIAGVCYRAQSSSKENSTLVFRGLIFVFFVGRAGFETPIAGLVFIPIPSGFRTDFGGSIRRSVFRPIADGMAMSSHSTYYVAARL